MKLAKLSDKDLAKIGRDIDMENKRRANRKIAASAILTVLRKHKLSINDLPNLDLGENGKTGAKKKPVAKRGRPAKVKTRLNYS